MQNELIEQFAGEMNKDFLGIVKRVVKEAKNGDMSAAKLLLDRALPARKSVEHYGAHEGVGGINIIISGTDGVNPKLANPPVEGDFEEIKDDE
jgi:hypothetical protein